MDDYKLDALAAPFPPNKVSWRVGSTNKDKTKGMALAYIDARDVMERLDEVVGPTNWQCRYPFPGCCEIGIWCPDEWIWKANGAGETNIEAKKGEYSDAFKRAGVLWSIGRYLYDLPSSWHPINQYKQFEPAVKKELTQKLAAWQEVYFARKNNA